MVSEAELDFTRAVPKRFWLTQLSLLPGKPQPNSAEVLVTLASGLDGQVVQFHVVEESLQGTGTTSVKVLSTQKMLSVTTLAVQNGETGLSGPTARLLAAEEFRTVTETMSVPPSMIKPKPEPATQPFPTTLTTSGLNGLHAPSPVEVVSDPAQLSTFVMLLMLSTLKLVVLLDSGWNGTTGVDVL